MIVKGQVVINLILIIHPDRAEKIDCGEAKANCQRTANIYVRLRRGEKRLQRAGAGSLRTEDSQLIRKLVE
jgi:hypothetical protein